MRRDSLICLAYPGLTIKGGRAINRGAIGGGNIISMSLKTLLHRFGILNSGLTIEYPTDPNNYLSRLAIGKFITVIG